MAQNSEYFALPTLFTLPVEHPDQARFVELYEGISSENALQEAQEILICCGAVSYCVDQLLRRHRIAQDILNKTPLADKGAVESLIADVIAPVWKLFEMLGISPSLFATFEERSDSQ